MDRTDTPQMTASIIIQRNPDTTPALHARPCSAPFNPSSAFTHPGSTPYRHNSPGRYSSSTPLYYTIQHTFKQEGSARSTCTHSCETAPHDVVRQSVGQDAERSE